MGDIFIHINIYDHVYAIYGGIWDVYGIFLQEPSHETKVLVSWPSETLSSFIVA